MPSDSNTFWAFTASSTSLPAASKIPSSLLFSLDTTYAPRLTPSKLVPSKLVTFCLVSTKTCGVFTDSIASFQLAIVSLASAGLKTFKCGIDSKTC